MANREHLQILQQGVEAWKAWRNQHRNITPDLTGANLRGADLQQADLQGANLQGAVLRNEAIGKIAQFFAAPRLHGC